jgi:hypothetical protein
VVKTVEQTAAPVVQPAGPSSPAAVATTRVTSATKPVVQQTGGAEAPHAAPPVQANSGTPAAPSPTVATSTPEPSSPSPSALLPVDRAPSPAAGSSAGSALPAHRTSGQPRARTIRATVAHPAAVHRSIGTSAVPPRLPAVPIFHGAAQTPTANAAAPAPAATGAAPGTPLPFVPPSAPSGLSALFGGASVFVFGSALIAALVLLLALVPPRPGRWLRPPDGLALVPAPLAAFERPG